MLYDPDIKAEDLTPLAIRPYPMQYASPWTGDGYDVCMRPIKPEDEPLMGAFNRSISPHSIYLRYFHPVSPTQLTSHEQLASMCFIDFDREITLVAERQNEDAQARDHRHGPAWQAASAPMTPSLPCSSAMSTNAPGSARNC